MVARGPAPGWPEQPTRRQCFPTAVSSSRGERRNPGTRSPTRPKYGVRRPAAGRLPVRFRWAPGWRLQPRLVPAWLLQAASTPWKELTTSAAAFDQASRRVENPFVAARRCRTGARRARERHGPGDRVPFEDDHFDGVADRALSPMTLQRAPWHGRSKRGFEHPPASRSSKSCSGSCW